MGRGRASAERRSVMGCGRAMEIPAPPRNAASPWDAAAPPWIAAIAPKRPAPPRAAPLPVAPERADAVRAEPRAGSKRALVAASGIGGAAAMGGVMHPHAAREGGAAAGSERVAAGIDGDVVMPPIDPAPAP